MPAHFATVAPLLPAGPSLAATLDFYTRHLGFTVAWQHGTMAGVRRGDVHLNLIANDTRAWIENASLAIGVDDLSALYAEYRDAPAKVGPLETKPWGRREFHLIDPTGVCFQFHQRPT